MSTQKKVLFVATVASHIKSFHIPYLKLFKENDYKTYVAANWNLGDSEELQCCDKFLQIPIQRSPYSIKNILAIKKLKKILETEKFDIIHCHTPMGAVVARMAAKKARKKYGTRVIYTAHGFHFYKGAPIKNWLLFYPVEWYLAKFTDTIITINKEDYELATIRFKNRCKDIQYIPGVGIDTKRFDIRMSEKEKSELKKSIGLKENDYVLTCVARLDRNKNQGFLIETMEELVKKNSNIHLLLVGPDELNGYYQNLTDEKELNNNIHFLGRREDIPELLQVTDIVVSASKREGLPVNVMEALSSGKPVVALECRGMRDLVKDGMNGYVNNKNEFSTSILKIYNKEELLSMSSIKESIENADLQRIVKKMKRIYFI